MEQDRYEELLNALRRWRDRFAKDLLERVESINGFLKQTENIYTNEGVGEDFVPWLDRFCRQLAIQFILKVLFIRVLEDRGLLRIQRIRSRDSQQLFEALAPHLGATSYLCFVFRDAARLLPDLFEEGEQDFIWPADDLSQEFLEEIWRRPDVEREGWLRYDFRGDGEDGFDTRFIGDLYQDIDAEARAYYALLQTPQFISQFILEHTLLKRFEEKDFREITLIDPTCGSGHFLVDAFYHFAQMYLQSGDYKEMPSDKARLARRIIEEHIFGADINPYACTLARFRLMLAACDFARPTDLGAFRDQHFNIVCCDSLIPYEDSSLLITQAELGRSEVELEEMKRKRFGSRKSANDARRLFSVKYDVVVGNPPYISANDAVKRDLYRDLYESAYRSFSLVAPFIERSMALAHEGENSGVVGLIVSNSFAQRLYGEKLIEHVLPRYELQSIIDLNGVFIPGHGTPTVILLLRNRKPKRRNILVLSNLKGEPGIPANPAEGIAWSSIVKGYSSGHGFKNEYVDVSMRPREELVDHPWQFGGAVTRLYKKIAQDNSFLETKIESIGFQVVTRADEVFICNRDLLRRICPHPELLKTIIEGKDSRNWTFNTSRVSIFPYDKNLKVIQLSNYPGLEAYFARVQNLLEKRVAYGKTQVQRGMEWFEYSMFFKERYKALPRIYVPKISTHNHFMIDRSGFLLKDSGRVIEISSKKLDDYIFYLTLLNSNLACMFIKELCFNKGTGADPVRDRYENTSSNIKQIPIPAERYIKNIDYLRAVEISNEILDHEEKVPSSRFKNLFELETEAYHDWHSKLDGYSNPYKGILFNFTLPHELVLNFEKMLDMLRCSRQRSIFLQEEIDWLVYEIYQLIPRAPLADNYLTADEIEGAQIELGQRAFEQAGHGYKGDWPEDWHEGSQGHLPGLAAHLPDFSENMKRLIQDRIEIIRTNMDIAILEDPLYKRRWIPPDYEKEFREALEWWMREMAEWELEQARIPLQIKEWSRCLMAHERVRTALEVYTGTPTYDPVVMIEKIIDKEAVPNRPKHFMSASGIRKLLRGEMEFKRTDFSDGDAWRVRGKLNIFRERYIAYKEFEPGWYGWAGWDAELRAEALVYLLEQAGTEGWSVHYLQCGLRASLRDLLPDLEDLPAAEQLEFETIAYLCGINEPCFCAPFREADPEERPPGFDEPSIKQHTRGSESEQISVF